MPKARTNLLIIDDDRLFCDSIAKYFEDSPFDVISCYKALDGVEKCKKYEVDVILLDQQLPDATGMELCGRLLEINERAKIIFITAFPSFRHAVQALRFGAYDYLSKPFELEELELAVNRAFRTVELEHLEELQRYHNNRESTNNVLIGKDNGLENIDHLINLAATHNAPVLITGETGTGKTVVAKAIHYRQPHTKSAFVAINCAALPETLIESEFFGHEKGAFTGADVQKKGLFEMACGGTLFLDEIGELPLHLQSKLLGVLDDGRFRRIGGQSYLQASVRIIAATNVDLQTAIIEKEFREDLYYRMSVMHIHLPPLRERIGDIKELCHYFLARTAPEQHLTLPEEELTVLRSYCWPGNVRELKNIIERSVILRTGSSISPSSLLAPDNRTSIPDRAATVQSMMTGNSSHIVSLDEMEKQYIIHTLDSLQRNHSQAAKALGIARSTLLRKIKQYGI